MLLYEPNSEPDPNSQAGQAMLCADQKIKSGRTILAVRGVTIFLAIAMILSQLIIPLCFGEVMEVTDNDASSSRTAKVINRIVLNFGYYAIVPAVYLAMCFCRLIHLNSDKRFAYTLLAAFPYIGPIAMIHMATRRSNLPIEFLDESKDISFIEKGSGNESVESNEQIRFIQPAQDESPPFRHCVFWSLGLGIGLPLALLVVTSIVGAFSRSGPNAWGQGIAVLSFAFLLMIAGGLLGLCIPGYLKNRKKK